MGLALGYRATAGRNHRSAASGRWAQLSTDERARVLGLIGRINKQEARRRLGVARETLEDLLSGASCRLDVIERVRAGLQKAEQS